MTADLAGIQFNDADALISTLQAAAQSSKILKEAKQQSRKRIDRPTQPAKPKAKMSSPQMMTPLVQIRPLERNDVTDDHIAPVASNIDPALDAKDAQETAEDAALLKRFKVTQLLGIGNYARVYKCSTTSGREIAVKAINLSKSSENYIKKFLPRELSILKRVNHTNICKTHEILQISDRIFILMPFCERGTIADLLFKNGALSEPVSRYFFAQTLEAVIYLHSIDIAHRDLKIENILLTNDFTAKLTDFSYSVCLNERKPPVSPNGLATKRITSAMSTKGIGKAAPNTNCKKRDATKQVRSSHLKLNETFCGTLPYLAPEVIRLTTYDAKKIDIWSLGICLYVMLNDRLPFPFNDIKSMVKKQLTKDFKFRTNGDFSEQLLEIVNQMLEPDFNRRLSSSETARHPWMNGAREKPSINQS